MLELVKHPEKELAESQGDTVHCDDVAAGLRRAAGTMPAGDPLRRASLRLADAYMMRAARVMR